MDGIGKKISALGVFLVIAGIVSSVLYLKDFNLSILMWIDLWGETIGWAIRGGLVVVGAILFFVGRGPGETEAPAEES